MRLAIVEDDPVSLKLMVQLVRALEVEGGRLDAIAFNSATRFSQTLEHLDFDLVIVDCHMPQTSGLDIARQITASARHGAVPVIMITADNDRVTRIAALEAGVVEFLNKPVDTVELRTRLTNIVRLRRFQLEADAEAQSLQLQVDLAVKEIREREEELIYRLSLAGGYKDKDTAEHTSRVASLCEMIATNIGLQPDHVRDIRLASYMHDIGKVGVPDSILLKAGTFTPQERAEMQAHTLAGHDILAGSASPLLRMAASIARSHHEHWDGTGYPDGLGGEDIPLEARIVAVADCYDALTSVRPYKKAWSHQEALSYLEKNAATRYDPAIIDIFVGQVAPLEMKPTGSRIAGDRIPEMSPGLDARLATG